MAVSVRYGTHDEIADIAGKTVVEVREIYQERWMIRTGASSLVNGQSVSEETMLEESDKLEFSNTEPMW